MFRPANVGALIRTAVAFNTTIIASLKSGDFYNEDIRASRGAFYTNLLELI